VNFIKTILSVLLLSSTLLAYEDHDIDGVDDSKDLCPNTPFDIIVDERGCSYDKIFLGKLTLQIGSTIRFNRLSDRSDTLDLYINYRYLHWDFSLSSSNYNTTNLNTIADQEDDLYLTMGQLFQYNSLNTKISVGTKFALMDKEAASRDNDYFASVNFDYFINKKQNIFLYYNYTLSGDSDTTDYNDFYTYSVGSGYALSDKWYSAISYNYAGSIHPEDEAYKAISWFNSYTLSKDFFISCNYAYALADLSYDHTISFNIGVHFE
jgi:hypothetical protein